MRTPPTRRSTPSVSTTCARTSIARAMAASRGRTSPTAFPTAASSTSCARTRNGAACSLPARSRPSTSRSTMASTGNRCATTCPRLPIRDLVIKDDDLVVGTHGRSFYILDDITPLRQVNAAVAAADVHLFAPQEAIRFRWNKNTDTPLPPDEPAGQNPPDGAILHYSLKDPGEDRVDRNPRRAGRRRPQVRQRRSGRTARRRPQHPRLLDSAASRAAGGGGPASVRVGHASRAAGGERLQLSDRGDLCEHPAHSAWVMGRARQIHGSADGRRQVTDPTARREDGSSREGDRGRSEIAIRHLASHRRDVATHVDRPSRDSRGRKDAAGHRSRTAPVARRRAARPAVWRRRIRRRGTDACGVGRMEEDARPRSSRC